MSLPRTLLRPAARALVRPAVLPRSASRALSSSASRASDKAPSHAAVDARLSRASNKLEADVNEHIGHETVGGKRKVGKHTQRTLASFSMENKTCVVTGGTRGLGNLIARTFVESGASRLAILDLDAGEAQAAAAEVVQWFEDHGQAEKGEVQALGIGCNVASEESVQQAMAQIKERFGSIDVVVNSAGIVHNFPAEEYPTDKMKMLYDVNINGSYFVAREAAKHMLRDGTQGSIILIASMSAGIVNIPQAQAPYNASKAAVRHLASSLAVEWAKRGIRVNSLSPGYMATALTKQVLENSPEGKELKAKWESLTPMGRMGEPEDLKGAAIYLASDASKFTTGQDIVVDGGYVCV